MPNCTKDRRLLIKAREAGWPAGCEFEGRGGVEKQLAWAAEREAAADIILTAPLIHAHILHVNPAWKLSAMPLFDCVARWGIEGGQCRVRSLALCLRDMGTLQQLLQLRKAGPSSCWCITWTRAKSFMTSSQLTRRRQSASFRIARFFFNRGPSGTLSFALAGDCSRKGGHVCTSSAKRCWRMGEALDSCSYMSHL